MGLYQVVFPLSIILCVYKLMAASILLDNVDGISFLFVMVYFEVILFKDLEVSDMSSKNNAFVVLLKFLIVSG